MKRLSILLPVLFVLSSTFACSRSTASESPSVNTGDAPTLAPVEKTLSSFNLIQGTKYLMAGIVPKPETRETSLNPFEWINNSSRSYYGYASYATYNYVFFDTETADYHRLLPTNDHVIYQTTGFPQLVYDPNNPDQPAPTIEFWVYSVVKTDFNKDGLLDHRDKLTVGVSDVGGNGYTELIENVDAVLSQYHKDNFNLFIIYNVNQKNFIARINLAARQLVSTTEMDLGEDVK